MTRRRNKRGQDTYAAITEAALAQVARGRSFEALSLRKLARSVDIVPTAFYRHFESMEALGLDLVAASFNTLRQMMREVRGQALPDQQIVRNSVESYVDYVHANRLHFHFILRERHGGVAALRAAIREQIQLIISELATDLARFPVIESWSDEDRITIATLIVNTVVEATELILEAEDDDTADIESIIRSLEKQLRMVLLAVPNWRSQGHDADVRGSK